MSADPMVSLDAILRAIDERRLDAKMNKVEEQLRAIKGGGSWTSPKGVTFTASPELLAMFAGLLDEGATMTVMSLFRAAGPHGEKVGGNENVRIGRALDITVYNGLAINLKTVESKENCIQGVVQVVANLPAGKYSLGLPRPKGGDAIDPGNDVFLPVTDHAQVDRSPKGSYAKDIELVHEPARSALKVAVTGNPNAKISMLIPDAVDHLHIKAEK